MKWIDLPCEPHDSLDWKKEIGEALTQEEKIIWKCRLGLESLYYPFEDEMQFQSAALSLKRFSEIVWPRFQDATEFVCLYRGAADFQPESFLTYCQMLSHKLPDEVKVLLLLDLASRKTPALALQLLSEERFRFFSVGLRGMDLPRDGFWWEGTKIHWRTHPVSTGLVFPKNDHDRIQELLAIPHAKIIFENTLSEEWEGLDKLILIAESVGPQALRKLQGFRAAGGVVIEI